ncbi:MAG: FixH family protein [Azospirillaceae bacterium]
MRPSEIDHDPRRGRWIPWAFVAFFGVVLVANGTMLSVALTTWTGLSTENAYERGLVYNDTLARLAEGEALGWETGVAFEPVADPGSGRHAGRVVVEAFDAEGRPIEDATVTAKLVRPTVYGHDETLALPQAAPGRYAADVELPLPGQWEVRATVVARGGTVETGARFLAP